MMRFRLLTPLLIFLLAASGAAQKRPNVLFVVSDDLNTNLGAYGHPTVQSPSIDRLADSGVTFNQAYCQWPACAPSRTSFMTGLYPHQNGVLSNGGDHFRRHHPNITTLPQLFRNNGYFVARVGKIYHFGVPGQIGYNGEDDPESWEEVVNPIGRDVWDENLIESIGDNRSFGATLSWLAADGPDEHQTDAIGAEAAIGLMERHKDEPFFIALGFYRPHTPYVAPRKYFQMYPPSLLRLPTDPVDDLLDIPAAGWMQRVFQDTIDELTQRRALQAYYASISFMDAQFGKIIDALDRLGLRENTIIVFISDHGYHMGEHQLWQKTTLFENSTRVPLIISAPGHDATRGKKTQAVAELVDLYPTLADLAGLEAPDYLSGVSLRRNLEDVNAEGKSAALTVFQTTDRQHKGGLKHRPSEMGYTIRTDRWRYTEWGARGWQGVELYDHRNDPGEVVNLAEDPAHDATVAMLSELLARRVAAAHQAPGLQP